MKSRILFLCLTLSLAFSFQSCSKGESTAFVPDTGPKPYDTAEELASIRSSSKNLGKFYVCVKVDNTKFKYAYDDTINMEGNYLFGQVETFTYPEQTYVLSNLNINSTNDCTPSPTRSCMVGNIETPLSIGTHEADISLFINDDYYSEMGINTTINENLTVTVTSKNNNIVEGYFSGSVVKVDALTSVETPVPIVGAFRMSIV